MAELTEKRFKYGKPNRSKLLLFGFLQTETGYQYEKTLPDSGLRLVVRVDARGGVASEMIDPSLDEPCTLHLAEGAAGSFVREIKSRYEETLAEIAQKCFDPDVFESRQAKELIGYVRNAHGDELEFLWKRFPDNAVWRRKDTGKWYGALLTVSRAKLGMGREEAVEIVDLRIPPAELDALIDHKRYFPGYHMNKKRWVTIVLDGSVPLEEICRRLEESYRLAVKT
ncbi:MAG TPA: MmcQ/YjbR family DNA-binding protein [Candidatus Fimivivens faecavium]|nr:MmcQ/YjbR family DNA-binding protein [Candidatus Fimivivens faecavium]